VSKKIWKESDAFAFPVSSAHKKIRNGPKEFEEITHFQCSSSEETLVRAPPPTQNPKRHHPGPNPEGLATRKGARGVRAMPETEKTGEGDWGLISALTR